jgi:hypothetical protein
VWSYYPWLNIALRTLEPEALFELRTNRNLVTRPEQAVLRRAHVAIAGLSVGAGLPDLFRQPPDVTRHG